MHKGRVLVLGSANMDLVVRAPRFPDVGETITGSGFATYPGGKGANQAAAVGRLGGRPRFVAKIGSDGFGRELLHALGVSGVDTGSVVMDPAYETGVAIITVRDDGRNTIVVAPGANAYLTAEEAGDAVRETEPGILVAQLEIPSEVVRAAAAALSPDSIFILNPAPARRLPPELLVRVDYLTPNETEAHALTGIWPTDEDACDRAAHILFDRGVRNVVFTLGEQGSYLATPQFRQAFPPFPVEAVDTTGAGDAFNGALAYFLAEGNGIDEAIAFANTVGALSTLKRGAIASMPTLAEVARFENSLSA